MEAAGLWLARLDSGSADSAAFARWRDADPAHAIAFAKVSQAWRALDETPVVVAAPPPARRGLSRRAAMLSAAGLAASVSGLAISGRVLARERAATEVGERRTVRVADGARVDLNTDSRLYWRAGRSGTTLWLERGEVGVTVAAGAEAVRLEAGGVVCGLAPGRYNARLDGGRLELTTLEGLAQSEGERPARAARRERLVSQDGRIQAGAAPQAALDRAEAWPQGEIVFADTALSEAVAEYNRYLERKLVIADPAVGAWRIGGRFTSADPTDFLAALEAVLPVRARPAESGVMLVQAE